MRIQTESRTLPTELSAEELAKESDRLAGAVKAVEKQEEHIAAEKGIWKDKFDAMKGYLSHLKSEMNDLAAIVESGIAPREVECSWLYALGTGYAFLLRDDTGEMVYHRKLGEQERQTELLEVLREPTAEQLAGWVESLGLVLDPQGDLPLAAPEGGAPDYFRDFVLAGDHGQERITARFSEADHRPASLTGVHVHPEASASPGLPEQVDRGALIYEDEPETLATYRRALEDLLEERKAEALKSRSTGEDEPPAPTPIGRGRKGK